MSHSSIVAREYGIPAVLGTGVATRRIRSGQGVRVDGDAGTVTLLDRRDGSDYAEQSSKLAGFPSAKTLAFFALSAGAVLAAAWWRKRRQN